jgi:hypothetical protein
VLGVRFLLSGGQTCTNLADGRYAAVTAALDLPNNLGRGLYGVRTCRVSNRWLSARQPRGRAEVTPNLDWRCEPCFDMRNHPVTGNQPGSRVRTTSNGAA